MEESKNLKLTESVEAGLREDEQVALNPLAFIPEAQQAGLKPHEESTAPEDPSEAASDAAESTRPAVEAESKLKVQPQ